MNERGQGLTLGHGFFHQGQIVMLIGELGGKTEDTAGYTDGTGAVALKVQ
ncbi:MAG TPA: hypothetical protein VK934_09490 [Fimbriimonas sp.]|nr:hypothetical protein [Fimbriimonas sp.]